MSSKILLVEDDPGLVITVSDLLSGEGYSVESAGEGESGLAKASTRNFDLIILDVMLPQKLDSMSVVSCASKVPTPRS